MTKSESGKRYAQIAAICYAIILIYRIIIRIDVFKEDWYKIGVISGIWLIILIGYVVTLFLKNTKAVLLVIGVDLLRNVYYLIYFFSAWIVLRFMVSIVLVILILMAIRGDSAVKKLWFIPGIVMMLGDICLLIYTQCDSFFSYANLGLALSTTLFDLIDVMALIFIGMWLKEKVAFVSVAPVNEYATFNPNSLSSNSTFEDSDKMKIYKELLDSGTITQEEFDARKKKILGL